MIVAIVARAEKFQGFGHQSESFLHLGSHFQRRRAVRHQIHFMTDEFVGRGDVHGTVVFSGDYGRIHQAIERYRLERNLIP